MKTFLKILGAMFVLGIIGIAGCTALVGSAANQASKDMTATTKHYDHSAAAFRVKFVQVKVGDVVSGQGGSTVAQVRALLGKPDAGDISRTTVSGTVLVNYSYHFFQATGSPSWEISFTNGRVTDKSSL